MSTAILTPQSFLPSEDKQSEWDLGRSRARCGTDHPHPPDREQLGAAIAEIQKVCYEWCVYGHCCGRGQRPDGSATGVVNPLEGGNARLLILRAWTTVPRPLLLGYTFQSLTRYKGDRLRSWLRPSVPISKGLYTHRGNRPISLPTITGLAYSELDWLFGRL